ncbi:MAG: hypothetical protein R2795_25445 [Saprospiraceae bacterium]
MMLRWLNFEKTRSEQALRFDLDQVLPQYEAYYEHILATAGVKVMD